MPTEEENRRCCILGGCGCTSGSPAQRGAMRSWLLEKVTGYMAGSNAEYVKEVDGWLDELFTDNPALGQALGDDG